jgi:uncharacterized damage-inducible protein DinB
MPQEMLARLFEHNHWANLQIIDICLGMSDEALDAEPPAAAYGSIRSTLLHLVRAQQGYLRLLTVPLEERLERVELDFHDVRSSAKASGEGFVALAQDAAALDAMSQVETSDGYRVDPWVIVVQAINHATEHREQIKLMLTALGHTAPDLDGWTYGEATGALVSISP